MCDPLLPLNKRHVALAHWMGNKGDGLALGFMMLGLSWALEKTCR